MKKLPTSCPSCESQLKVKQLQCENCSTEVLGLYELPHLAVLSNSDQMFILDFVKASGSLKLMAQKMGLSYPSVRNKLDEIIDRLKDLEE
ncbi:MAG: DUF2089 family protein [Cyclobacteriaceae bacterium]|nr:DUF2089 family protein [Cyclobacteriaceae bacterium HetDA_MAG_MS6]